MFSKTTVVVGTLSVCAGLAAAQGSWTAVSITGSPDPIIQFDLGNPGGSQVQIGTTNGNFNRGFDWADQNTAYYHVPTDLLNNPGDRGIYRYDALSNTSTQIFAFGFDDSGAAGGAYANGSYWFNADEGNGDTLFRYDIGSGTLNTLGATGLTGIQGLAVDAAGRIVAIDTDDNLYELDGSSGASSLVGNLGIDVNAIGGLDYSADGQLVALTDFGLLYAVDDTTGAAGTFFGDLAFNGSTLSFRVPTPGAAGVLALGGLVAARRRR
ncbi:MAG: hypothetical protein AAF995_04300 [Planctomycetota bacterium]